MAFAPRFLVVGLGGIGGIVAAHLLRAGHDVLSVTTNSAIRAALQRDGFRVANEGAPWTVHGPVMGSAPAGERFDFVVLATQPPKVETAARESAAHLAPAGAMVVLQNGLCEERIAEVLGPNRVVGGIVSWGASTAGPGRYVRTAKGRFTFGTLAGTDDERCRTIGAAVASVGPWSVTTNLRGARWTKLAFNCAVSTLGTVGGDRLGALIRHAEVRRLGLEVMTEVVQVAAAEGVKLERLSGTVDLGHLALTPRERQGRAQLSLLGKHALLRLVGARYRNLRSSMLAAIERGRPPAVDFLNGEVVQRARRHGIHVPVNELLTSTVHRIASGLEKPGLVTLRTIYEDTRRSP